MKENNNDIPHIRRLSVSRLLLLLKKSYHAWNARDPFRQSAVIAYYAIFSLPGLLVIIIAIASLAFGHDAVTGQLSSQIGKLMGQSTAKQIEGMIANATIGGKSLIATILAVATMLLGATGVFVQLQKTMNLIWDAEEKPKRKFFQAVKDRLLSLGVILSLAFLMVVSLITATVIGLIGELFNTQSNIIAVFLEIVNFVMSFVVTAVFFGLMYKYLPDAKVKWRNVLTGAIIGSALFSIGKFAIGFYFTIAKPATTYGAAGSVILVMLWVFYSCMIFFFGAEVSRVQNDLDEAKTLNESDLPAKPKKQAMGI